MGIETPVLDQENNQDYTTGLKEAKEVKKAEIINKKQSLRSKLQVVVSYGKDQAIAGGHTRNIIKIDDDTQDPIITNTCSSKVQPNKRLTGIPEKPTTESIHNQ